MRLDLQKRLFISFVLVIIAAGIVGSGIGVVLINRTTVAEAQNRIRQDLRSAWAAYNEELEGIKDILLLLSRSEDFRAKISQKDVQSLQAVLEQVRIDYGWDFLSLTDPAGRVVTRGRYPFLNGDDRSRDALIQMALQGDVATGTLLMQTDRLEFEGESMRKTAFVVFEPTPKAKRRVATEESAGMALQSAVPIFDARRNVIGVLYGGVLLNRRYVLVDHIKDTVFKGEKYEGKDIGTVTIFQWDVRIATNVMKENGNRAIGTRVSEEVYDLVLENARSWQDRAFVVNDWYITAYDPILDFKGKVVGILYVGVLEAKYDDLRDQVVVAFLGWMLLGLVLVLGTSYVLAQHLVEPIRNLVSGAQAIANNDLEHRVSDTSRNDEIGDLTRAFNTMAVSLESRERELRQSNQNLRTLNRNYLDMLGMVSHELKNAVGTCLTNAYSLRDGILGEVTTIQKRALDGIAKNLDYFEEMIKNYLDLSRIETGDLRVEKRSCDLFLDIVEPTLNNHDTHIQESGVCVQCNFGAGDVSILADPGLLRIVYNNLIENALKYGKKEGKIVLGAKNEKANILLNVWNNGPGIPAEQMDRLFRKFSRIENVEAEKKKGTGLGLFITREIIEKQGGKIWVESEENAWANFLISMPQT